MTVNPQAYARTGGALYLLIFLLAPIAVLLPSKLVVPDDGAATAANIMAAQPLWRICATATLLTFLCDVPLSLIFYVLMRPVDSNLSLLSAMFRFAEAVSGSVFALLNFTPLLLLNGAAYLHAIPAAQLQATSLAALKTYNYGFGIALIPFGFHCALLGYLMYRSGYLPKTLGVLMAIAGLAYVVNSLALLAAPAVANVTYLAMVVTGLPAELGTCLWLLIAGVNVARYREREVRGR